MRLENHQMKLPSLLKLQKHFFVAKEHIFMESGELSASGFLYPSGVHALRIQNTRGELIILPFKGQQIWRATFDGHELTMKSMFDEPPETEDFGASYGCFMLHCGMTAMGNPSAVDTHPQHGELPALFYDTAYVAVGEDDIGRYIEVGGEAYYRRAFEIGYIANPQIRLYEDQTLFDIRMTVTNKRNEPLSYAYLCHVNFRPVEGAEIYDTSNSIVVHQDVPGTLPPDKAAALLAYIEELARNPRRMYRIDAETQIYEPEIVFTMRYDQDERGWAHCMQLAPEGDGHYVAFRPDDTPYGIRWIARTGSEDALGMALPATAEHKGLHYCRMNGQMKTLPPHEAVTFHVKAGYLDSSQLQNMRRNMK